MPHEANKNSQKCTVLNLQNTVTRFT